MWLSQSETSPITSNCGLLENWFSLSWTLSLINNSVEKRTQVPWNDIFINSGVSSIPGCAWVAWWMLWLKYPNQIGKSQSGWSESCAQTCFLGNDRVTAVSVFVPPPCCKITAIPFYSEVCIIVGFLLVSLDYWVKHLESAVIHSPTPGLLHGEPANEIPIQGSLGKVWEGNSWLWQTVLCVLLKGAKHYRRARIFMGKQKSQIGSLAKWRWEKELCLWLLQYSFRYKSQASGKPLGKLAAGLFGTHCHNTRNPMPEQLLQTKWREG